MAKEKVTITIDRAKLDEARKLLGAGSASGAIDAALSDVIRRERVRRDIAAYKKTPTTAQEAMLAGIDPAWCDLSDDTDWEAEWPGGS